MNDSNLPGYGDPSTWPVHARELISDEAKQFTESREFQDWLAQASDCIAHGHDVTWDVRQGLSGMKRDGVYIHDVLEALANGDKAEEYTEICDALVVSKLKGDDQAADNNLRDIRVMIRVEAMKQLAAKADSYAEYLKQQEREDMAEAAYDAKIREREIG